MPPTTAGRAVTRQLWVPFAAGPGLQSGRPSWTRGERHRIATRSSSTTDGKVTVTPRWQKTLQTRRRVTCAKCCSWRDERSTLTCSAAVVSIWSTTSGEFQRDQHSPSAARGDNSPPQVIWFFRWWRWISAVVLARVPDTFHVHPSPTDLSVQSANVEPDNHDKDDYKGDQFGTHVHHPRSALPDLSTSLSPL